MERIIMLFDIVVSGNYLMMNMTPSKLKDLSFSLFVLYILLLFKDLCKEVHKAHSLIPKLTEISSYFHKSARVTIDLDLIGTSTKLRLQRFPKYNEIRWAEFTESLLNSIFISWRVLILYFAQTSDPTGLGLGKLLTNFDNLKLFCFASDLFLLLQNVHKKLQSDLITIVDVPLE